MRGSCASRVGAIWQAMTGETDGTETTHLLGMLVDAVEARVGGGERLDPQLAGATGRRLVHALRTALVRGWAEESLPPLPAGDVSTSDAPKHASRSAQEAPGAFDPWGTTQETLMFRWRRWLRRVTGG